MSAARQLDLSFAPSLAPVEVDPVLRLVLEASETAGGRSFFGDTSPLTLSVKRRGEVLEKALVAGLVCVVRDGGDELTVEATAAGESVALEWLRGEVARIAARFPAPNGGIRVKPGTARTLRSALWSGLVVERHIGAGDDGTIYYLAKEVA